MYNNYPDPLEWPPPSPSPPPPPPLPLPLVHPPLPSPPLDQPNLTFPYISHPSPLLPSTAVSSNLPLLSPRSPPPSSSSSTAYAPDLLSHHYSAYPVHAWDTFDPPPPAGPTVPPLPAVPAETLLSAASCLAFDPQQALEQLNALSQPASPGFIEPRTRQRVPGLTKQQRTERKKQKHREIDAVRRHREHGAVTRMQQLMEGGISSSGKHGRHKRLKGAADESAEQDSDGSSDEGEQQQDQEAGEESGGTTKRRGDKMDKVSVMERAAEHMERMQAVLQQMVAACTNQQQHLRYFLQHQQRLSAAAASCSTASSSSAPPPLSTLHPYASQRLHAHVGSAALSSAYHLSAPGAIMVVSLATGCFLHANDRFLSLTGWQPSHLIGRLMMPPPHSFVHQRIVPAHPNSYLVDSPDGLMREACFFEQHEHSKQLMGLLLAGQQRTMTTVWRFLMKDSRLYDVESTSWIGYQDNDEPSDKQPAYVVFVTRLEHRVRVMPDSLLNSGYS